MQAGSQPPNNGTAIQLRRLNALLLVLGLGALAFMISQVGVGGLRGGLDRVGFGFAGVLALHASVLAWDTVSLWAGLGEHRAAARPWRLFRATLAGHAISSSTPLGQLGDITKYALLIEDLPREPAAAAIILQNLFGFLANVSLLVAVPPIAVLALGVGGWFARVLLSVAAAFVAVLIVTLYLFGKGPGEAPFLLAARLGIAAPRVARARGWWRRVESISRRAVQGRQAFATIYLASIASRLAVAAETWLILSALGLPHAAALSLLQIVSGQVIAWATSWVPMQAGTAEGGIWLLFRELGLDARLGVVSELIKKVRRIVFVGVGIAVLGVATFKEHLAGRANAPGPVAPALPPS